MSVFEFELALLPLFFVGHVLLPVLNTLGKPLFHKTGVSLQLVDLGASHLLLVLFLDGALLIFESLGFLRLSYGLIFSCVMLEVVNYLPAVEPCADTVAGGAHLSESCADARLLLRRVQCLGELIDLLTPYRQNPRNFYGLAYPTQRC